jgi:hypothetical protein
LQFQNLGAFFAALRQKTGLSAAIPHKPLCGLLRDFRCNPLRGPQVFQVLNRLSLYAFFAVAPQKTGVWNAPRVPLLQFLANRFAVCHGLSAAIQVAWANSPLAQPRGGSDMGPCLATGKARCTTMRRGTGKPNRESGHCRNI